MGSVSDADRTRAVRRALWVVSHAPKAVLWHMLRLGGLTRVQIRAALEGPSPQYELDPRVVDGALTNLRENGLVQACDERWQIPPEIEPIVRKCFEAWKLVRKTRILGRVMRGWAGDGDGPIDVTEFTQKFWTRIGRLRDEAAADYAEDAPLLSHFPSTATDVRQLVQALNDLGDRVHIPPGMPGTRPVS